MRHFLYSLARAGRALPELWATLALALILIVFHPLVPAGWKASLGWQLHPYQVFATCVGLAIFMLPGAMLLRILGLGGSWLSRLPTALAAAIGVWVLPSLLVAATALFDVRALMFFGWAVTGLLVAGALLRTFMAPGEVEGRSGEPHVDATERLNPSLAVLGVVSVVAAIWLSFQAPVALDDNLQVMYVQDDLVVPHINEFEPVFGADIAPSTRGSLTTWPINLTAITFMAGLPAQQTFWLLRTPLVLLNLLAVYTLGLVFFKNRNQAVFLTILYFMLTLIYTKDADGIGFGMYARGAQDKFVARYTMLPAALAWSLSYLRRPRWRTYWLAGVCTLGLSTTHPIGIILLAIPLGGLGSVHLLNHLRILDPETLWPPSLWGFGSDGLKGWLKKRLAVNWPVVKPFALLSIFSLLGVIVPLVAKTSADAPVVAYSLTDTRDPTLWYRVNLALDYQRLLVSAAFGPEAYIVHPRIFLDAVILIPFIGLPLLWWKARKNIVSELILGTFLLNPALLLIPPLVQFLGERATPWLLYRLAWPLSLLGPVAITWAAWVLVERVGLRLGRPVIRQALPAALVAVTTLVLAGDIYRGVYFLKEYREDSFATQCRTLQPVYSLLPALVGDGTVVLSTPDNDLCMVASAAYAYPVEFGLTTTINRFPEGRLAEALQRFDDVYTFTSAKVVDQRFMDILTRWNVGLIMIRTDQPIDGQLRHLPRLFELVLEESHYSIYRVQSGTGVDVLSEVPVERRWNQVHWEGHDPIVEANTLWSGGQWDEAIAAYQPLLSEDADTAYLASIGQGRAHLAAGRRLEALAAFMAATRESPESPLGWLLAGNVNWLGEDYAAMAQTYQRVVDIMDWNPEALSRLGEAYRFLGRLEDARSFYERAVSFETTPGTSTYYRELGSVYLAVNWTDDAVAALERAVSTRETLASYSLLSQAYLQRGDLDAATGAAGRARRLNFWSDIPRDLFGEVELKRGDRQRALDYFKQALFFNPQSPAIAKLASTSSALYGTESALARIENMIGYKLGFAEPVITAARLQQALGFFDEAQASGWQAWRWNPVDSQSAVFLGNLEFSLGERETATSRYQDAAHVNPFNPAPFLGLAAIAEVDGDIGSAAGWAWMAQSAAPYSPSALIAQGRLSGIQGDTAASLHEFELASAVSPYDASPLVALADHQLNQGKWDQALINYRMALTLQPDAAAAWHGLASGYLTQGQIDEAKSALEKLVDLFPAEGVNRVLLAGVLEQEGDQEGAAQQLERAVELDPGDPSGYTALAQLRIRQGRRSEAETVYGNLIDRLPSLEDGYVGLGRLRELEGRVDAAEELYRQGLQRLSPEISSGVSLALADLELRRGAPEEAVKLYAAVIQVQPMMAAGSIGLARAFALQGDLASAKQVLQSALDLQPALPTLQEAWALLLIGEGSLNSADQTFTSGLAQAPDAVNLALGQARLYAMRGEPDIAMGAIVAFHERWPGDLEILAGGTTLAIGIGRPDEALGIAHLLTTLAPGRASSWTALGDAHANLGQFDLAEEAYRKATELEPGKSQAWLALAEFLSARARSGEATDAAERAMAADKGSVRPYMVLADILIREGNLDSALGTYRAAADLNARDSSSLLSQAQLLLQMGRQQEAQAVLDLALSRTPTDPRVYAARAQIMLVQGNVEDARHEYTAATLVAPGLCRPLVNLAGFLAARGERSESKAAYEEALVRAGCVGEARVGLGELYLSEADPTRAMDQFQRAVSDDPGSVIAPIALARAYMLEARPAEAVAVFDQAISRKPASGPLHIAASRLSLLLAQHSDALNEAQEASRLEPQKADSWIALAEVQRTLAMYEEAEQSYKKAVETDRSVAFAHLRLGEAYAEWGRFDEAEGEFSQALSLAPDDSRIYVAFGMFIESRGRTDEAVELLVHGSRVDRSKVGATLALSRLYSKMGRSGEAANLLKSGLERAPYLISDLYDPADVGTLTEVPRSAVDLLIALGDIQRYQADWAAALDSYQSAIKVAPGRVDGYLALGEAYEIQGGIADARTQFETARQLSPGSAQVNLALADWYRDRWDWAEAERMYRTAMEASPADIRGYLGLADLLRSQGRFQEARTALEAGVGIVPSSSTAFVALGNWLRTRAEIPAAETAYRWAIRLNRADPAGFLALGELLQARGLRLEALLLLQQTVSLAPTSSAARLSLGSWYELERNWEAAESEYRAAIALSPNDPVGYLRLGDLFQAIDRPGDSGAQYQRALALAPGSAMANVAMGDWYIANLDRKVTIQTAAQAFEDAKATARQTLPGSEAHDFIDHLSTGVDDLQSGNVEGAYQHFEQAIAIDPDSVLPYLAMGQWYRLVAGVPAAEQAYQLAIETVPADVAAYIRLGRLYQQTTRPEDAKAQFERAVQVAPGLPEPFLAMGDELRQQGDWAGAEQAYRSAIEVAPGDVSGYASLGTLLWAQGNQREALAEFGRAVVAGITVEASVCGPGRLPDLDRAHSFTEGDTTAALDAGAWRCRWEYRPWSTMAVPTTLGG